MSRIQLALNVDDLDAAIAFYSKLFGMAPAKVKPGYANFAIADPPLKLVLLESDGSGGPLHRLHAGRRGAVGSGCGGRWRGGRRRIGGRKHGLLACKMPCHDEQRGERQENGDKQRLPGQSTHRHLSRIRPSTPVRTVPSPRTWTMT